MDVCEKDAIFHCALSVHKIEGSGKSIGMVRMKREQLSIAYHRHSELHF
jgi:hypothetical protein